MLNVDFNNIESFNTAKTSAQVARAGCYIAAGCLVGRKVGQAAVGVGYKAGSAVANFFENRATARRMEKLGDSYLAAAQKNMVRDLTIAATAVGAGLALEYAEDTFALPIADFKADQSYNIGEKLGYAWNNPRDVLNNGLDFVGNQANKVNTLVYGDQRYGIEKAKDFVVNSVVDSKNYLLNDFRLTAPVTPGMTRNVCGQVGPQSREKAVETAIVVKDFVVDNSARVINHGVKIVVAIKDGVSAGVDFVGPGVSYGVNFVGKGLSQIRSGISPVTTPLWNGAGSLLENGYEGSAYYLSKGYNASAVFFNKTYHGGSDLLKNTYHGGSDMLNNTYHGGVAFKKEVASPAFNSFVDNIGSPIVKAGTNYVVKPGVKVVTTAYDNKEGTTVLAVTVVALNQFRKFMGF